jgi:hypothetical protein
MMALGAGLPQRGKNAALKPVSPIAGQGYYGARAWHAPCINRGQERNTPF